MTFRAGSLPLLLSIICGGEAAVEEPPAIVDEGQPPSQGHIRGRPIRIEFGKPFGPVARDPGGAAPAALNPSASLSFWLPCYNCYTCYKASKRLGFCG